MPYPPIPSHRIPYDIDGSVVGWSLSTEYGTYNFDSTAFLIPPSNYFSQLQMQESNDENFKSIHWSSNYDKYAYFVFFPELREVTHFLIKTKNSNFSSSYMMIQGSVNSTNGSDGTWENGVMTYQKVYTKHQLRQNIQPVSFSGPVKVLRIGVVAGYGSGVEFCGFHLYGFKYAGETPDDILYVDSQTGVELSRLTDWEDRPEGTTLFKEFKVKNSSPNKIANGINLQLNHSDFLISWNPDGPWTSVLDIQSLGPGALSSTIYIKNQLAPPSLTLGPTVARIITSIGSWI